MQRFHVSVAVADIDRSINFYRNLFGVEPSVRKEDYAKWMLEDPAVNFSVTRSAGHGGIDHVGIQFDGLDGLRAVRERLSAADAVAVEQDGAECCYAQSDKSWVRDPDGVVWEAFVTHGQRETFGKDHAPIELDGRANQRNCCA